MIKSYLFRDEIIFIYNLTWCLYEYCVEMFGNHDLRKMK